MKLQDAVIVITGSADRLGREIAITCAKAGSKVIVHCHTDVSQGTATVATITEKGGSAALVTCDLTEMKGIKHLVDETIHHYGRWDILINCASIFTTIGIEAINTEQWGMDQNLHQRAPFFLAQALYKQVKGRAEGDREGCIINITDTGVRNPVPSRPSYYCAKTALESQTVILGRTLAPYVRVNAVAPGAIIPASKADEAYFSRLTLKLPLGHLAQVTDVVDAILFLARNDSITGQTIVVDGGEHLL